MDKFSVCKVCGCEFYREVEVFGFVLGVNYTGNRCLNCQSVRGFEQDETKNEQKRRDLPTL